MNKTSFDELVASVREGGAILYEQRREAAAKSFESLPRGSRAECSFAIRKHPSIVSDVLSGKRKSPDALSQIENWLANLAA